MQKFSALLKTTYHFTDRKEEMPEFLAKEIQQALGIDWAREPFIASCWVENFLSKGKLFVLVTIRRVAYKDPGRLQQNLFQDMTGVEKDFYKNINLLSSGNPTKLFPVSFLPADKLLTLLFSIINAQWIKSRESSVSGTQINNDIIAQIERLNQLKNQGILTSQEFVDKKTELLSKL